MAESATNGRGAAPAVNGRAYPIEDHAYDVVVIGAGGAGLRATVGCSVRSAPTGPVTAAVLRARKAEAMRRFRSNTGALTGALAHGPAGGSTPEGTRPVSSEFPRACARRCGSDCT